MHKCKKALDSAASLEESIRMTYPLQKLGQKLLGTTLLDTGVSMKDVAKGRKFKNSL